MSPALLSPNSQQQAVTCFVIQMSLFAQNETELVICLVHLERSKFGCIHVLR